MRLIMLWGNLDEAPMAAVLDSLKARGHKDFVIIDQNELAETELEYSVSDRVSGQIKTGGETYDLADVSSVYLRPYGWGQENDEKSVYMQQVNEALTCWCEISPALVVNKISTMASNGSKPYQSSIIKKHGFKIPDTLITTSSKDVDEFCELHGDVIYKSISGVRSIVSRLTKEKMKNIKDIVWCPTQFQQQVAGTDIRVHVVDTSIICSEITTNADDYRYAGRSGNDLEIKAFELPESCRDKCVNLVKDLGLAVGGVDLRVTSDGEWYCFEVNPSPGFTYYQSHTGQDISGEIADLLIKGQHSESNSESASMVHDNPYSPAAISIFKDSCDDVDGISGSQTGCRRKKENLELVNLTG